MTEAATANLDRLIASWYDIIKTILREGCDVSSKTRLNQMDYEVLADFRHALRTFMGFSVDAARGAGLTTQQHQALLAIKGHRGREPISIGCLAEQLIIAPHTAAELVARLEAADLVKKIVATDDRRKVHLSLTKRADTALLKLTLVHLHEVRVLAPRIMSLIREIAAQEEREVRVP